MIQEYVTKLIDNLPDSITQSVTPIIIDLVLDGGAFNGSYLVGALQFLKEMEKRNYVKIRRISGCSIGSFAGFLYFIDELDMVNYICEIAMTDFKEKRSLPFVTNLKSYVLSKMQPDVCSKINNKLFISYHNIAKNTKVVKYVYKTPEHLINALVKSCFIPYLIDGNIMYENKYVDGITPYIFKEEKGVKILYLDLFGMDKLTNMFNIKNEKTPTHRVLSGLLDIHNFFIKQYNTPMCSYVNEWSTMTKTGHALKLVFEKIVILLICALAYFEKYAKPYFQDTLIYKIIELIVRDIFIILFEHYCV
jgi:hypothetical protein